MTVEPDTMPPAPVEDADDFDVFDLLEGMATTSDAAAESDGEHDVEKVARLSSVNNEIPNNSDYGASFSQSHSPSTPQVVDGASDAGTGPGLGRSEICSTSTKHSKSENFHKATEANASSGTFFSSCKEKAKEACASVWSNFFSTGTCTTSQKQDENGEFEHRSRKNRIAGKKAAGCSSSSTFRSENNIETPKKPTFKVWKTKVLLDTENNNADKTRNPNPRITDNNLDALRSLESKLLPASYSFEIEKILKKIAKHNYKHIGLQMPDGLIAWAPAIGQILRRFTKVVSQTVDEDGNVLVDEGLDEKADSDEEGEKNQRELIVSILGDVNFGACCVDDLTAQSLGVEFLVHFGHSCLIPTKQTSVKTMYVHVEVSVNIDHFVNTVEKNFFAPTMLYGVAEDVDDDSTVVCKPPQQQLDRHSSEQDFSSTLSTISSMQDSRYPILKAGDELVLTAAAATSPGAAVVPEEEHDLSNPYLDGGEDDDSHDDHDGHGSPHSDANSQISTKASSDCNLTSSPEPTPIKGGSHSDSEHCHRRGTMTSRTRSSTTSQNSEDQREKILFPNPFNRSRLNKRVAILGTVQFATVIDKAKKELQRRIRNTIQNERTTTSDNSSTNSSSHTIPLYQLELFTQTQTKPLGKAEVLGCTAPSLLGVDEVIFVCDGRFHLEAVMLRNPQANFYLYNPYSKELTVEKYNYEEMLVQRKQAVNSVKTMVRDEVFDRNLYGKAGQGQADEAQEENKLPLVSPEAGATCGIILGTLGRQGSVAILERLLDVFRKWNKARDSSGREDHKNSPKPEKIHHVVFLLSEISPQVLHEYEEEVDFWVQIACPRLSLDWGSAFEKPCLTTYECYLVFFDEQKEELEHHRNEGDKQDFPQNIFTDIEKRQFEAALGLKQKHISQWNVNSSCCGGGSGGGSGCGSGGCGEIREGEDVEPSCNKEDIFTSIHDSNQPVYIDAGNNQSAAEPKDDANSLSRYWPEVDYYANAGGPWANYSTAGSQDVKFSHL
ncbi:unnamed protein product [Amoebophrya sp. A120]|nr:unnamed protein product [Amoebophrya sp. A120]|eukprot:GSA120T00009381001.1